MFLSRSYSPRNSQRTYQSLVCKHHSIKEVINKIENPDIQNAVEMHKITINSFTFPEEFDISEGQNIHDLFNSLYFILHEVDQLLHHIPFKTFLNESETRNFDILLRLIDQQQKDLSYFLFYMMGTFRDIQESKVDTAYWQGETFLMHLAKNALDIKLIKRSVENGANPFLTNHSGDSAFSMALRNDNIDLCQYFLKQAAPQEHWTKIQTQISTDPQGFIHYIAANMHELKEDLGLQISEAVICFKEAKNALQRLGESTEDLNCYCET